MTMPLLSTSTHKICVGLRVTSVTHNHPLHCLLSSAMVLFSLVVWLTLIAPLSSSKSFKCQYYVKCLSPPFCPLSCWLIPSISLPFKSSCPSPTVYTPLDNSSPPDFPSAPNLQPAFNVFSNSNVSTTQWCYLPWQIVLAVLGSLNTKQHSGLTFRASILSGTSICWL